MQMIPDHVPSGCSAAEQRIFRELRDLEVPGWTIAMHSINLPEHARKRSCEIDFLLIGEQGLLGLEVKGGQVSRRDGVWRSLDLRGRPHRLKESPLTQISTAMHALETRLRRHVDGELVRRTIFGYGVVFPDCDFDIASVEWEPEMVLDGSHLATDGWKVWLGELGALWANKPGERAPISLVEVEQYREVLRPDFEQVRSLRQLSSSVEATLAELTNQQYRALDLCKRNARLIFEGGAGTGKTMLATEICRRAADAGERVLLTCRSGILANFVRSQPKMEDVTVAPFHQVSSLPAASFDLVVVDEAQDVINTEDLCSVDAVLLGGLRDGRWMFLLDSNNQRGLVGRYEDAAMETLRSFRPAEFGLADNCRNTIEIVTATQQRTGADLGVTTAGHGLDVEVIDGVAAVAGVLDHFEETQVPLDQVVLLSPHPITNSVFADLPEEWRRRVDQLDLSRLRRPTAGRVGFAEIADYKGLESRFVIVESLLPADTEVARAALYVGMTRARAALWVVSPEREGA
jgi:nuclease-like protein/AAA domain-containing protein/UvrD-like helicase family protein